MQHKISILAFLGLVAALLAAAPANADGIHEWDADAAPYYWHDVHVDVDKFSPFDHDHFEGANSDFIRPLHDFHSGVPNTAEWIWWLNHSDNKDFGKDPVMLLSQQVWSCSARACLRLAPGAGARITRLRSRRISRDS